MTNQIEIARTHAGYALLHDRALLSVTGADATRWLNGMVTNSAQALQPGEGNYNFLLNAQGRIQGDCLLYRIGSETEPCFLLVTDERQIEGIQAHLDRFIIMDDVELTRTSGDEVTLRLEGPEAPSLMKALGLPAPDPLRLTHLETPAGRVLLLTPPASSVPGYEVRATRETIDEFVAALQAKGIPEFNDETIETLRILDGKPSIGKDIHDRELPQETGQEDALHFAKGCYLGQEIVERIRSRGQVHRVLTPLRLEGGLPDNLPAPLQANGKPAGEITSAVAVQIDGSARMLGLGYVRREALDTRAALSYPEGSAFVRKAGQLS